ncbi:hypothetical protein PR202_ga10866 [Eleusine coracana subsp. coracana]|uniref:Uncharacterized protein n=1 Tax=Eleusine coracana subsp. coracana TaxID=191504 RepID=A0AAV5C7W5_ELECO|nr:hypothetical protein PR202_ga10866 [Eleusine coracana subsp. coracana]
MMIPVEAAALLLLLLQLCSDAAAQAGGVAGPQASCPTSCGNVSVPYPFGIGASCYLPGFSLTCDRTRHPPRLLLGDGTLHVVEISLANATLRAMNTAGAVNLTYDGGVNGNGTWGSGLGSSSSPYIVSERRNQLVEEEGGTACSGIGCCETPIPFGRPAYGVLYRNLDESHELDGQVPTAVRIAERGWFDGVAAEMLNQSLSEATAKAEVPVVLEWAVASTPVIIPGVVPDGGNSSCPADAAKSACRSSHSSCHNVTGNYRSGYVCRCVKGYDGNPYLDDGCQDIDECALPGKCYGVCTNTPGAYSCRCPRGASGNPYVTHGCTKSLLGLSIGLGIGSGAGLLFLVLGAAFLARKIKNRRTRLSRQKFFKQNRGHLLQQLVSQKADIAERMIIPLAELEIATNNFDKARELGGGGHGTVYKGILTDQHVVAIKKSKVAIQREIDEFINEVTILSQINHRNVVKLYGCCLETEVPLLVHEFISNGTLYNHLHVDGPTSLPWEDRMRIATESARALSYLHKAVSFPIIHRDIKSHNILLDGSLTAKVSDFGASRCIPDDATNVLTAIQGTLGYLDPIYYYTGRLTEKSDVYSFGVVLIELLTRKKPYSYRSPQEDSLVAHFTSLLSEDNLVPVLHSQVLEEGGKEVREVAALAASCVMLKAEDRPTMRNVEMTLESIQTSLQKDKLQSASTKLSRDKQVVVSYAIGEVRSNEESSRQYSLEEEFLLSARYPR